MYTIQWQLLSETDAKDRCKKRALVASPNFAAINIVFANSTVSTLTECWFASVRSCLGTDHHFLAVESRRTCFILNKLRSSWNYKNNQCQYLETFCRNIIHRKAHTQFPEPCRVPYTGMWFWIWFSLLEWKETETILVANLNNKLYLNFNFRIWNIRYSVKLRKDYPQRI